jgi:short subunit dehydrogenase-like uncharacterized protein
MADRDHELVLFGATGFTGELTAEYLLRNAPSGMRWALAARNLQKLEAVRRRLARIDPAAADLPLLQADVSDAASIEALAQTTKVVITTVGPYTLYGEPLVAACAATGTDYVDLTGEPEFVDRMWLSYHEQAQQSGARIVHSCGFDSIPSDLGALFTVNQLPEGVPIELAGFALVGASFSGGTYHSTITAMSRLRQGSQVARERRAREQRPVGRRVHGRTGIPHDEPAAGGWVVPAPLIDVQHVLRSARALDRYGPDFSYSHYVVTGGLVKLAALSLGVGTAAALAQLPFGRDLLLKLKDPGEGPSAERRAKAFFRVRLIARTPDGRRLVTEVTGGDPGYGETSKMLAESALCLARDELPALSGQLTTAVAMGQPLIDRLQRAGIGFRVVENA